MTSTPRLALAVPTACGLACAAFAVVLVVGVSVGHPAGAILARSLVVMLVVWPIGLAVGGILNVIFRERVEIGDLDPSEGVEEMEADNAFDFVDETQVESDGSVVGTGG